MSPVTIFFIIFISILIFIAWSQFFGAPWIPSSHKSINRILELAAIKPGDVVYDLGSGDGRILLEAAKKYKADARGVEIDPIRYLLSKLKIFFFRQSDNAKVRLGNLFSLDLRDADIVIVYLLQETNDRLVEKLTKELSPGTKVISNTFIFNGLKPVLSDEKMRIHLYEL